MNESLDNKIEKIKPTINCFEGFVLGVVLTIVIVCVFGFASGLKSQKEIERDMINRGFGFYTCNEKTGEVTFEYYKMLDIGDKGEKTEKKGK